MREIERHTMDLSDFEKIKNSHSWKGFHHRWRRAHADAEDPPLHNREKYRAAIDELYAA